MIDTVIFDLDGTLLDTSMDLTSSVNHALKENGFKTKTVEEVKAALGAGPAKLVERVSGLQAESELYRKVLKEYLEHYNDNNSVDTRLFEGIPELLTELKSRKLKTAVLSNKQDIDTQAVISHYLPDTFDIVMGTSDKVKRKPSTDGMLSIVRELGTTPENCLYIGDSGVDIETASKAGIRCISVTYGFRSRKELEAAGGTTFIDQPLELLRYL